MILFKSCYAKHAINPTGKTDKNYNDKEDKHKYLIDDVLEKFNQTLRWN